MTRVPVRPGPVRRVAAFSVLAGVAVTAGLAVAGAFAFDVRLGQAEIQAQVDSKLPVSRTVGPAEWRADSAAVTVLDGGRVGVDARLHAALAGREASASVRGSSGQAS